MFDHCFHGAWGNQCPNKNSNKNHLPTLPTGESWYTKEHNFKAINYQTFVIFFTHHPPLPPPPHKKTHTHTKSHPKNGVLSSLMSSSRHHCPPSCQVSWHRRCICRIWIHIHPVMRICSQWRKRPRWTNQNRPGETGCLIFFPHGRFASNFLFETPWACQKNIFHSKIPRIFQRFADMFLAAEVNTAEIDQQRLSSLNPRSASTCFNQFQSTWYNFTRPFVVVLLVKHFPKPKQS